MSLYQKSSAVATGRLQNILDSADGIQRADRVAKQLVRSSPVNYLGWIEDGYAIRVLLQLRNQL